MPVILAERRNRQRLNPNIAKFFQPWFNNLSWNLSVCYFLHLITVVLPTLSGRSDYYLLCIANLLFELLIITQKGLFERKRKGGTSPQTVAPKPSRRLILASTCIPTKRLRNRKDEVDISDMNLIHPQECLVLFCSIRITVHLLSKLSHAIKAAFKEFRDLHGPLL